jgi:PhzF family phenazine biosynthesis protein
MELPIFQVDAFTSEPFKGNPAGVCLLETAAPESWMQSVAAEMNCAETAFLVPRPPDAAEDAAGDAAEFDLRWFTPVAEVPICGHATLASAHILYSTGRLSSSATIRFHTLSGVLLARHVDGQIELDFPAIPIAEVPLSVEVRDALGVRPIFSGRTPDRPTRYGNSLVEVETEQEVREARPDFPKLLDAGHAVILTARATSPGFDFVSRYFAPDVGINEDPVTGSAHCSLAPYWGAKIGKTSLKGYQASQRGGSVRVTLKGDRVLLGGDAVTVLRGTLDGPE